MRVQPLTVSRGEFFPLHHDNARRTQVSAQPRPDVLLIGDELTGCLIDTRELLRRCESVVAQGGDTRPDHPFEPRHANHVELVEIRGGDRKKAQALEQRVARVLRLFQNPAIEAKPR